MIHLARSLALAIIAVLALATVLPALAIDDQLQQNQEASQSSKRLKKEALTNPRLPDFTSIFNWGLKLRNIKDLYLFAGIAAQRPDLTIVDPMNYISQTNFILEELDLFLAENDLDRDDIIRIEFTLVEGYTPEDFGAILGRFADYFQEVSVKPAAGTLRVVSALAFPGLVVEYEVWCAA
ncbi:MAG: hypothetical protein K0U98_26820 [Deltaproteobacteria bacterium]|nr:hypothetical protein [Deltaproteobacteria bacterium]